MRRYTRIAAAHPRERKKKKKIINSEDIIKEFKNLNFCIRLCVHEKWNDLSKVTLEFFFLSLLPPLPNFSQMSQGQDDDRLEEQQQ